MSVIGGPKQLTNGLNLYFDAANYKSFAGVPTINLIPSPNVNAFPTVGNSWGTYNTNQYGSGTYFSIGTVSSVSSNIVTMTSNHSLRTYDVMQPQTTGGGVTAGTNYFIKKISNTQFSLHEYNGSQDGSQGYINSSTGDYKVYDSIATDTRVSINATSFPTMWWGYPHLPNSGLVKEIISNGFTDVIPGINSSCIRLHYIRSDDVKDGMAYGVDCSVTPGATTAISFYTRSPDERSVGKVIQYYNYNYTGGSANAYSGTFTLGPVGVWQRQSFAHAFQYGNVISYWFAVSGGVYSWDWACMQVEAGSTVTPFVAGTRGATVATGGGTADISRNSNNGELVNGVSYDSGNQGALVFDGDNDRVTVNSFNYTPYCLDFWLYNNNTVPGNDSSIGGPSTYQSLISFGGGTAGVNLGGWTGAASNEALHIWSVDGSGRLTYTNQAIPPGIYNWVFNWNGSYYDIWVNGIKQTVYASTGGHAVLKSYTSSPIYLGSDANTYEFYGKIYTFKMYSSLVADTQIIENFNALRSRFGV